MAFDGTILAGEIPSGMEKKELFKIYAEDGCNEDDIEDVYKKICAGFFAGNMIKITDMLVNTHLSTDLTSAISTIKAYGEGLCDNIASDEKTKQMFVEKK